MAGRPGTIASLVAGSPDLRRVVLAFAAFNLADWGRWLAILIYAYDRGGAAAAGAVSIAQLLPAAVLAPFTASLGDRMPRSLVLRAAYAVQGTLMVATGLAIAAGAAPLVVYATAILGGIAVTLTRPAHYSILPSLAQTTEELTAANAASTSMENIGILLGQLLSGIVIQLAGSGVALLGAAGVVGLGLLAVVGVRPIEVEPGPGSGGSGSVGRARVRSIVTELVAGFAALARSGGPRTIVLLLGAGAAIWGALDVLVVVLALGVLQSGEGSVGIFNAAIGIGGLAGGAIALGFARRRRLAMPFAAGLLVWSLPIAALGILSGPLAALVALGIAGIGRSVMEVAGQSLLQRSAHDETLSRVMGVLEAAYLGAFGLGAVAAPGLLALVGVQPTYLIVGLSMPVLAILLSRPLRAVDRDAAVPARELELIRGVPMLAVLSPATQERLARRLVEVAVPADAWVMREGEAGEVFQIIDSGEVEVSVAGRTLRRLGPGGSFGEIALLRQQPRSASVRTLTAVRLYSLERAPFLSAVTGLRESQVLAAGVVADRLATG